MQNNAAPHLRMPPCITTMLCQMLHGTVIRADRDHKAFYTCIMLDRTSHPIQQYSLDQNALHISPRAPKSSPTLNLEFL